MNAGKPLEKTPPPLTGEWERIGFIGRTHVTLFVLINSLPPQAISLRHATFASVSLFSLLPNLPDHPMSIIIAMGWGACALVFFIMIDKVQDHAR